MAPSQNVCTIGSGDRIGSTISAPQITPSTPMKRVSRPIRIALRQITTQPMPSASEESPIACVPGMPISWAATSSDDWPMSSARSTVCGAVQEARDLRRGPEREHHGGDRAEQAARQRDVDPEAAEAAGAVADRGAQVGEHERDRDEAEAARDRGQQHGDRAVVVELEVLGAQARERADAALAPRARQRVDEAGDRRVLEHLVGADAGADDQQRAERGRDRGPRALPGLPLEGLVGGGDAHAQAVVRSGGPPIGVRAPPARIVRRGGSGSISLRPATRETRSPAKSRRSSAGAATRIRASIRRTRACWAGVRAATGERL